MKLSILVIFLLSGSICYPQKFSLSIDAQLAVPQGDYKVASPDAGYGLRPAFHFRPSTEGPFKVGLEVGFLEKGRARQYFTGVVYGFYEEFQVSAVNNIFSLMAVTRIQSPKRNKVKPFVDLTAGYNIFFSTVSVERLTYYSSYNTSYSNSSKSHWAFTYGIAGGVDIPLNKRDDLGLELKVAYLQGAYTEYLTDPYIQGDAQVTFIEKKSRTNMLIPQAGLRISL